MTETGGARSNPHGLPRQRNGVTPQMVGRYPDYDVLREQRHWDAATRRLVVARIERPPPIRFFDEREARTLAAFCDLATAQDGEPRIAVLAFVDERLHRGLRDGWRYFDMPEDDEVWRRVARGLDEAARVRSAASFADAPQDVQTGIVHGFSRGELHGGVWDTMNVARAWSIVMRYVVSAFYAHPWAWNEIGFGGPAYPRGYAAFGSPHLGEEESWEAREALDLDPVRDVRRRGLD